MRLGIPSPGPSWASFSVGPLTLHTYALCILAGIVAAVWLTSRRLTARGGVDRLPPGGHPPVVLR